MRVLVVHPGPAWATADVYHGWCNGLHAAGAEVRTFNLDSRLDVYSTACRADGTPIWPDGHEQVALVAHDLHGATFQFAPDWVLVIAPKLLPVWCYDTLRARRVRVAMLHTESPYLDVEQLVNAEHADLNLINDPTNIDQFREIGPVAYVPHAYDPARHHPGPSKWDADFAWVGTAGATFPSRTRFFEQVTWPTELVVLAGLWDGVTETSPIHRFLRAAGTDGLMDNNDTVDLYRGTRISANLYRSPGDHTDDTFNAGWAMGPREVELAATGTFFARHSPAGHGGEGDQILGMLPTFTEPDELAEIVAYYLDHDDTRTRLAVEARAAVADRTFEAHARTLITQL